MLLSALASAAIIAGSAQAQTLRFGHANSLGEVAHDMFIELADRVNKRTNGAVTIRLFPSEQLGKEVDLIQQVKGGALDMSAPSMPALHITCACHGNAERPFPLERLERS